MSEGAIKSECDGRQTCALDPNNRYYGDPCVYTVKYIDIEHVCIKKTNSEPIKSEPRYVLADYASISFLKSIVYCLKSS